MNQQGIVRIMVSVSFLVGYTQKAEHVAIKGCAMSGTSQDTDYCIIMGIAGNLQRNNYMTRIIMTHFLSSIFIMDLISRQ